MYIALIRYLQILLNIFYLSIAESKNNCFMEEFSEFNDMLNIILYNLTSMIFTTIIEMLTFYSVMSHLYNF